ncbi:MAG: Dps family protein [Candidatus Berkiella sp.]
MKDDVIMPTELKKILADTYALYLKSQNYHWNVEGIHFQSLHSLFETHYKALSEAVDEIAERIRALGFKAPGSFKIFDSLKTITDANENASAKEMLEDLKRSHQTIQKNIIAALEVAQQQKDEVTIGLLVDRLEYHEKTLWMLGAHLAE